MASNAWTANRDELVRELAKARAQAATATAKALEATERAIAVESEAQRRLNGDRARRRRREQNKRAGLRRIKADRELMARLIATHVAIASTPVDPNAHQHCLDLLAALKEKP